MYRYITNKYYQNEIILLKLLNDKLMYKIIQKYDTETWHLQRAQHQYAYSPYCSLYISKEADKENLCNNQELL